MTRDFARAAGRRTSNALAGCDGDELQNDPCDVGGPATQTNKVLAIVCVTEFLHYILRSLSHDSCTVFCATTSLAITSSACACLLWHALRRPPARFLAAAPPDPATA